MKTQVTRMKPDPANMVVEWHIDHYILLCVECGWEGKNVLPSAPWVIFQEHDCRLIIQSVSTGF